jgi:hypothetical protein
LCNLIWTLHERWCHPPGGTLPPPASDEEQREWIFRIDAPAEPSTDSEDDENDSAMNLDRDPHFPYPDGPGHKLASPQAIKIIWNMMKISKVKSFRPDLSQPMNSPGNKFLWNLAKQSFLKLIECGEYASLNLELFPKKDLDRAFKTHVEQYLVRMSVLA